MDGRLDRAWEGDTLIVDTIDYRPAVGRARRRRDPKVVERFTQRENATALRFTIDDPSTSTAPSTGEFVWRANKETISEPPATRATTG